MYHLSNNQVDFILDDIKKRGIQIESLQQNLLDHVCCMLENEMKPDDDFEKIYSITIQKFYKNELYEIEQETNYLLTFKNFYFMKKVLILSGIAAATSFVLGSIFKIMHWPGSLALYMMAMSVSSFLFLPLLFLIKNKELKNLQEKLVLASGIIVGMLYCTAVVGRIVQLEFAKNGILWLIYIGFAFFVFVPLYFFTGIRKPEMKINTIVVTLLFIIFISSQFLMVNLQPLLGGLWHINK
ncbi:MAG: hypothetical protein RIQ33_218 [Bacteroidota bacterium]